MLKSWKEVKNFLKECIESEPSSQSEVIKRAGLSRDTYYKLFAPGRAEAPMRKATVHGLADALFLSVRYENGFPQFSTLNRDSKGFVTSVAHAQEVIKHALDVGADMEYLAKFCKIPIEELEQIMSASNFSKTIPVRYIQYIALAIGKRAVLHPSGKITIEPSKVVEISPEIDDSTRRHVRLMRKFRERDEKGTSDSGLLELMDNKNRNKHMISDAEAIELISIANRRNTQTTLEHWISILYTLRGLDSTQAT